MASPKETRRRDAVGPEEGFPTIRNEGSNQEEDLRQEITKRLEEFCRDRGFKLSPSRAYLINDLVQMRKLWGDYYCPCQPERSLETVCVCAAVKDGLVDTTGACFCQLVVQ